MADLPKRIAIGMMAGLFLVTTVGFTGFIIWQVSKQEKNNNASQTQPEASCNFNTPPAEKLPKPSIYKPTNKVSKLEVKDLKAGTGAETKAGDCISAKYYGTLVSGKKFDENFSQPLAIQFTLGVGSVIPGWDQGLIGMKAGGTRRLVIPPALAYGDQAAGDIPANSTLVFVVKLVKIGL